MRIHYKPFTTFYNCEVPFITNVGLDDESTLPDFINHKFDAKVNYFEV
jgi:hypothetical protein